MVGVHARIWRALMLSSLSLTLSALASCGGGAGITPNPNPNPNPGGGTSLSGQIQQDSGARVASAAGWGVGGASVALVDPATGETLAEQTCDGAGNFSLGGLIAGDRLLQVGFAGRHDLDGDGTIDSVEVLLPLEVRAGENNAVANFSAIDNDSDGQPDGVLLKLDLSGAGRANHELREIQCKNDTTRGDDDKDGTLTDEQPKPDVDNDGIPDDASGRDNSLHGGVIHGEISAIGDHSITVNGIEFTVTDTTRWRIHGVDGPANPARFTVGTDVLVRGLWNGTNWIALGVMKVGAHNADHPGRPDDGNGELPAVQRFGGEITALSDNSLSIGDGHSFLLTERTLWFDENGEATSADFAIGDKVVVKAEMAADGSWTALAVYRPSPDDPNRPPPPHDPGLYDGAFHGSITAISSTSLTITSMMDPATGVMNGETHTFVVSDRTQWYAADGSVVPASEFAVGDMVGVKAMRIDDRAAAEANNPMVRWLALAVMQMGNMPPPPGPGNGSEFLGSIKARTETSLMISSFTDAAGALSGDLTFAVGERTQWYNADGSLARPASFAIGDGVKVKAVQTGDPTTANTPSGWFALAVMKLGGTPPPPPPDDHNLFYGSILELTATGLSIIGLNSPTGDPGQPMDFLLSPNTMWMLANGMMGGPDDFSVGDQVKVKAQQSSAGWMALAVMQLGDAPPPPPDDYRTLTGSITELTDTSITIHTMNDPAGTNGGSFTFGLTASTLWVLADGTMGSAADFAVGETVTVKGQLTADGAYWAVKVYAMGSGGGDPGDPNNPMG